MSKKLSPLEALKRIRQETCPATYNQDFDKEECCDIIETALKEYDELFKMFPCEETTARQMLIVLTQLGIKDSDTLLKKLKALEVCKKVFKCNSLYAHHIYSAYECGWITQEEYDLLKEVLL